MHAVSKLENSVTLTDDTTPKRPNLVSLLREARTPLALPAFILQSPALLNAPRGDGRPVLLAPGYMAGALSMQPLAAFLRHLGYRATPWRLGRNDGDVERLVDEFLKEAGALALRAAAPVTLIGWSLGGVVVRETARLAPDTVREVITMGSPIVGGPKYTAVGNYYARRFGIDLDAFEKEVDARNRLGLKQPVMSIYSKSDGVVDWRASIDSYNPHARNVEISGSHFSLGLNVRAWRVIADTLGS